jgi:hypothetical protein
MRRRYRAIEQRSGLTREEFERNYLADRRPVVIESSAGD